MPRPYPRTLILFNCLLLVFLIACGKKTKTNHSAVIKDQKVTRSCLYGSQAVVNGHCGESGSFQVDPYRFAVAIGHRQTPFFCSGVLIHPEVVMTAGHCIEKIYQYSLSTADLYVYFGPGLISSEIYPWEKLGDISKVKALSLHPEYYSKPYVDLGLVILSAPVFHIPPVKILRTQTEEELKQVLTPGSAMTTIGFGLIEDYPQEEEYYGTKHHVSIALEQLLENDLVLKGQGRDICPGDSGGPVLFQDPQKSPGEWFLVAINSRSLEGCGKMGPQHIYSGFYALVPLQLNYVKEVMEENQIDTTALFP